MAAASTVRMTDAASVSSVHQTDPIPIPRWVNIEVHSADGEFTYGWFDLRDTRR